MIHFRKDIVTRPTNKNSDRKFPESLQELDFIRKNLDFWESDNRDFEIPNGLTD